MKKPQRTAGVTSNSVESKIFFIMHPFKYLNNKRLRRLKTNNSILKVTRFLIGYKRYFISYKRMLPTSFKD